MKRYFLGCLLLVASLSGMENRVEQVSEAQIGDFETDMLSKVAHLVVHEIYEQGSDPARLVQAPDYVQDFFKKQEVLDTMQKNNDKLAAVLAAKLFEVGLAAVSVDTLDVTIHNKPSSFQNFLFINSNGGDLDKLPVYASSPSSEFSSSSEGMLLQKKRKTRQIHKRAEKRGKKKKRKEVGHEKPMDKRVKSLIKTQELDIHKLSRATEQSIECPVKKCEFGFVGKKMHNVAMHIGKRHKAFAQQTADLGGISRFLESAIEIYKLK